MLKIKYKQIRFIRDCKLTFYSLKPSPSPHSSIGRATDL